MLEGGRKVVTDNGELANDYLIIATGGRYIRKLPSKRLGESAVDKILARMAKQGIETHLGYKPVRFEADKVVTEGGEFAADLILFMPGLTGPAWLQNENDLPLSSGGFIQADECARVKDLNKVFVAGDAGSYPGPDWMAKKAHQADLQSVAIAKNIAAELQGQPANIPFTTELACIIDSLDGGTLVYRRGQRSIVLQ